MAAQLATRGVRGGRCAACGRAPAAVVARQREHCRPGRPQLGAGAREQLARTAGQPWRGAPAPPPRAGGAARAAPPEQQSPSAAAQERSPPPQPQQLVRGDALSTMQEEQEAQLKAMATELPTREARFEWLAFWVGAAVAFGAGVWYVEGAEKAQEFFAGYLLEQSLSIDNLFVFVLVFNYFKTPLSSQPKVLTYGIVTAAVLRAVMILLGTELIQKFEPLLIVFALILLYSAYGLLLGDDEGDEDLSDNAVVKICRRLLPVTGSYDGDNFFSAGADGARLATPLLLTLAVVELSDVVFAVDSIPAVFGVTLDPFIVYTSNMFAILSLRSLYAFVSTVMTELRFLDKAVALVLGFIGAKMLLEFADVTIPTSTSLLEAPRRRAGSMDSAAFFHDVDAFPASEEGDVEPEQRVRQLEAELAEVRKELAAKTVQLATRPAGQEKAAEARAAELAAAAAAPREQLVRSLEASVAQLEAALAQRSEELEESRRLFASQKRALKDALAAAAEREAAEAEADAAGRSAAAAEEERELERLLQELSQLKTRSALELAAREAELGELRRQLAEHESDKQRAVEAAQAAAAAAQTEAVAAAEAAAGSRLAELESELARARAAAHRHPREDTEDLAADLAAASKARLQVQREYDAFKDLTEQTHRQHRAEQARMIEEVAALKARVAADAARAAAAGPGGGAAGLPLMAGARGLLGSGAGAQGKTFGVVGAEGGLGGALEQWVARLDRRRRGLAPLLAVGCLVALVLLVAVVRAAASARGEHRGLCFLSNLGIQIGDGCGPARPPGADVAAALSDLVEATPRVRDVPSAAAAGGGGAAAAGAAGRRLAWRPRPAQPRRRRWAPGAALSLRAADCAHAAPLARLGQRFTGCREVAFALTSPGDAGAPLATLLPALARLPRLTSLRLDAAASAAAGEPALMAATLGFVQFALPGLRSLELALGSSWADSDAAWRALGVATQLTRVAVRFFYELNSPVKLHHLSALTSISGLASLDVGGATLRGAQHYGFLAGLLALTQLVLPLACDHQGVPAIATCTGLRSLAFAVLPSVDYDSGTLVWPMLGEAECPVLARCTRLTALIISVHQGSDPHLLAALTALTGLQKLTIEQLSRSSLPCLASLSQLTSLHGRWVEDAAGGAGGALIACPSVVELWGSGPVPFEAFPSLRDGVQRGPWPPATLRGLASHCSGLTALDLCGCEQWAGPSFEAGAGAQAERVAAVRALAGLNRLRWLSFSASDDAEVAALTAVTQVTCLTVRVPVGSACTPVALMGLARMTALRDVRLQVFGLELAAEDARAWLRALHFLNAVRVSVTDEGSRAVWVGAAAAARAAGHALPAKLTCDVVQPRPPPAGA
ncbi:hypothetical protein HT031_003845 [Scenedesmus sp. PABB004]|nr:hypothetical protein HT031_003845 [Scenedesmus sp. PABB004]